MIKTKWQNIKIQYLNDVVGFEEVLNKVIKYQSTWFKMEIG